MTETIRIERFEDAAAFEQLVRPSLLRDEIGNNLLLSTTRRVVDEGGEFLLLAARIGDRMPFAAVRYGAFALVVSKGEVAAVRPLAVSAAGFIPDLPGVVGPVETALPFADAFSAASGRSVRPDVTTTLYALWAVPHLSRPAAGLLRLARAEEARWIADWLVAFATEAGLPHGERTREYQDAMTMRRIDRGLQFVWKVSGRPVSIASCIPVGDGGARIGGVYTPPAERGRGYASACVAAISQRVLDEGKTWCSLFADAANPVSNAIYQRLGYREDCTYGAFGFTAR
jgi:RimJ/RimL family protein N-acetyltransferase